jgi:hypothetical protein
MYNELIASIETMFPAEEGMLHAKLANDEIYLVGPA